MSFIPKDTKDLEKAQTEAGRIIKGREELLHKGQGNKLELSLEKGEMKENATNL